MEGVGRMETRSSHDSKETGKQSQFQSLLTPEDAGNYLRIHPKTAVRYARKRSIPALRIGKHWRFRQADLTEWAENQLQSTCQPVE